MISPSVLSGVVEFKVAFQVLQTYILIHPVHVGIELLFFFFLSFSLLALQD